ncbi:hypothetical protein DFH09DRAFT_1082687 [Mycena vulgaris]|nr:hypothetical protein DFH09DRAFT_1082687 [Mycena vulgaris]
MTAEPGDVASISERLAGIQPGPISKLTLKPLLIIAEALGITIATKGPNKKTVPEIKIILNGALRAPEFAANEEFQKFVTYTRRPGSAAPVQNSADKARNDVLQSKSDQGPATGAHKKLLDNMGKTDPPPQFKPLGGGVKKEDKDVFDSDDEKSSVLSSAGTGTRNEDQTSNVGTPKKDGNTFNIAPETNDTDLPIIVQFKGPTTLREVWIPPTERSQISVIKATDDSGGYSTSLKKLLPFALGHDSPVKKSGKAKLAIIGPLGGHLNLGVVDDFADGGFPENLKLVHVDQYKLAVHPAGLVCSVMWEPKTEGNNTVSQSQLQSGAVNLTGPESKPLEVAQERLAAKTATEDAKKAPIVGFLRTELKGPARKRPTVRIIGEMLDRHKSYSDAVVWAKAHWSDGPNKFRVPENHDSIFKGMAFKTEDIQAAVRVKHTTANSDDKLFRSERLQDDATGKAEAYVEEGKHKKVFDGMSVKGWDMYLKKAKEDKEAEERSRAREEAKEQERKRKRRREGREGREGETKEERKERKRRRRAAEEADAEDVYGAGPSRRRGGSITSQTLDHDK